MARRWAMVITHVAAPPMAGSNRVAVRHLQEDLPGHLLGLRRIAENSSDHAVHRAGQPVVHGLERDLVAARHVQSRSSRSCSPLLSVDGDLNQDASGSLGFT
jgi:hypothetical protein